jgi:hypothetical protein
MRVVSWLVVVLLALPLELMAQQEGGTAAPAFSQGELEQILAPIALYPDEVLAQILMASTYPLEIVEADRWVKQNSGLKGDALTAALEKQRWDPSVKSLVNFPQVLAMLSEKLDWTQKLGDAFLSQEKDVMQAVQTLRRKAESSGNLKSTSEQKVIVEKETIIIQPANPQVVYVPAYNPVVVYGAWAYPAYPPYPVYPPGYTAAAAAFTFAAGVAVGAAWGYAWGNCNWHGGSVNYNINQNININNNINRNAYAKQYQGNRGNWQHNPAHRQGVGYRDRATAQRYGQSGARSAEARRDARGYGSGGTGGQRPTASGAERRGAQQTGRAAQQTGRSAGAYDRSQAGRGGSERSGQRSDAFSGVSNGSREKAAGDRGLSSRNESFKNAGSSFGGGAGGSRSGASSLSRGGSSGFGGASRGSGGAGLSRSGGGRGGRR